MDVPAQDNSADPAIWTTQEAWVWKQITQGQTADFNAASDFGGTLDPRKPDGWPASRVITERFLQAVLFAKQNQESITWHGVDIVGAWFDRALDLSEGTLDRPLALRYCRFDGAVSLARLQSSQYVNLRGSRFSNTLSMYNMRLESDLLMGKEAEFSEIVLTGSRIAGDIDLSGAKVGGVLKIGSAIVGGSVFLKQAELGEVQIWNARIEGNVELTGSTMTGGLNLNGAEVGGALFLGPRDNVGGKYTEVILKTATLGGAAMNGAKVTKTLDLSSMKITDNVSAADGAEIANLDLHGSEIGGQVYLSNSTFTGTFIMEGARIGGYLLVLDARVQTAEPASLKFADISAVNLSGSTLPSLDMTGTRVHGEFRIGEPDRTTSWTPGARLGLRNAAVGALHDGDGAWPAQLDMTGFTYDRLGGGKFAEFGNQNMSDRSVEWFKDWLGRQRAYSPQPYEQLASVLVAAGAKEKADAILYEGRRRERREVLKGRQRLWSIALDLFIGYGYHSLSRILFIWLPVFTLAGTLALTVAIATGTLHASFSSDFPSNYFDDLPHRVSYSLDKFLPLVKLREFHFSKIQLDGWIGYYFDFQQLMGYFLGSLLVVGITGIARKSQT